MKTNLVIFCAATLPRAAWAALLETQPSIFVTQTAVSITDLTQQTKSPTAVFIDTPQLNEPFIRQLATAVPHAGLLFLVDSYDSNSLVTWLQAGATGFLDRNASVPDLARAIIAIGRGEIVLPPQLAPQVLRLLARGGVKEERPLDSLTEREKEVLTLLAQGLTNKDIAQTLILSVRTIEAHLRNIFSKLQVQSRTEAVLLAVHHGY